MPQYKNIAISGDFSTGKSTLARNLSQKLGWNMLSGDKFIKKWFKDHDLEFGEDAKIPEEIDRELDNNFQKQMQSDEHTVFESWLAGYLAKDFPDVLKVLCITEEIVRMERGAIRDGLSLDQAKKEFKNRAKGIEDKFKKLYKIEDFLNPKYFDIVVDTTLKSPEVVMDEVLRALKS
jgi:predicted cytidylate kinase